MLVCRDFRHESDLVDDVQEIDRIQREFIEKTVGISTTGNVFFFGWIFGISSVGIGGLVR